MMTKNDTAISALMCVLLVGISIFVPEAKDIPMVLAGMCAGFCCATVISRDRQERADENDHDTAS